MAEPVTFAGGFGQQLSGLAGDLGDIRRDRLLEDKIEAAREQQKLKNTEANRKQADSITGQLLAVIKAGGQLSPELIRQSIETQMRLDPDRSALFQALGKNLGAVPIAPVRGTPEDLETRAAEAAVVREPISEAAERAGAIKTAQEQAEQPDVSDRSTDLVDITPDAQGQPIATLKNEATNSVRGVVADAFGGTYDPISQRFIGLDKDSAERALNIQTEAEELLRTQQELTIGSAVRRALRAEKAKSEIPAVDEERTLEDARAAIKRGAPEDKVKEALKELGIDPGKL